MAAERWALSDNNVEGIPPIRIESFQCRFLVLASAYAGAVEENLIRHYMPVWNDEAGVCYGIGKHGDAATTRKNTRSPWDTLHPGRAWALAPGNVANPRAWPQIIDEVHAYCITRYSAG